MRRDKQKQAEQENHYEQNYGESQQQGSSTRFAARLACELFCLPLHCVDAPILAFILGPKIGWREFSRRKSWKKAVSLRSLLGSKRDILRTKIEKKREKSQKNDEDFEVDLLILNELSAIFAKK